MLFLDNLHAIKCKNKEVLFFLAYFLLIQYRFLKSTMLGIDDYGITYIIIMILLIGRIFMLHVRISSFFSVCVLCPLFILCLFQTWDPLIPIITMMLLTAKDISFRRVVKVSFVVTFTLVLITLFLCAFGIVEDITSIRYFRGHAVVCHGAGFNHSSKLPTYYFFLFLEYYYLKSGKVRLPKLLIWAVGGALIFHFCAERLRFYNLIIAIILIALSGIIGSRMQRIKRIISLSIYPALCLITNYLGYFYNPANPFMYALNIALTGRLYLVKFAFNHYGVKLFGQSIKMGENAILIGGKAEYFYIDSGYSYIFIVYGLIIGTAILITYMIGMHKAYKHGETVLLIWFTCVAIDSLVGNQMLSIWICPLLFVPFCGDFHSKKEVLDRV